MKTKTLIFSILILFSAAALRAQYHQIGIFGGGSNFAGDIGPNVPDVPRGYAMGAFYRLNFNRHWALRAQFNYGEIKAADKYSNVAFREIRNLSFQSKIWEGSLMAEFNFFEYEPGTKLNHTPYLVGGAGLFWFEPKTTYQGNLVALQPLGTEGQGTAANASPKYAQASSFFVFGLGYRYAVSRDFSIAVEATFRNTNTDYLDDVSGTFADPDIIREEHGDMAAALSNRGNNPKGWVGRLRGDPSSDDWYIFTGFTLEYKLDSFYEKCAQFF